MTRRYENRVFSSIWNELDVRIFETTWRTSYRNAITTANILRWRQHFRSFSRYESLFPVKSFFSLLWAFFFVFLSRQKTATLRSLYVLENTRFSCMCWRKIHLTLKFLIFLKYLASSCYLGSQFTAIFFSKCGYSLLVSQIATQLIDSFSMYKCSISWKP